MLQTVYDLFSCEKEKKKKDWAPFSHRARSAVFEEKLSSLAITDNFLARMGIS